MSNMKKSSSHVSRDLDINYDKKMAAACHRLGINCVTEQTAITSGVLKSISFEITRVTIIHGTCRHLALI